MEGERLKCGVCFEWSSASSYILLYGRFVGDILGNLQNQPPSALMIPPEEARPS